jgi:sugar-specific transcriptional regulator TrmB
MEEVLRESGLTTNECRVYLAMLRLKSALAGQITQHSGVHRRNVYDALERLIQKGLVSYVYGRKRKYFKAEPPGSLLNLLDVKKKMLSDSLPKLNSLFLENQPEVNVRVYSGKAGLRNIFEDQLASRTDILVYGKSIRDIPELTYYFPQHRRRRLEKKIKVRAIFDESARKKAVAKLPLAKIKYLPDELMGPVSTNIYNGKVAIMLMLETPTIILIENHKLYEAYRNYFELLWKIAK